MKIKKQSLNKGAGGTLGSDHGNIIAICRLGATAESYCTENAITSARNNYTFHKLFTEHHDPLYQPGTQSHL